MVSDWAFVIICALVFVFGIYIGFLLGQWAAGACVTTRDYWKYNIVGIVVCVVAVTVFGTVVPIAYPLAVGLMGGYIAGLKMGFSESVGPWKIHDRVFNVNKDQRKVAEDGTGEERRRRRKEGKKAPDLISVDSSVTKGSKASSKKDAR